MSLKRDHSFNIVQGEKRYIRYFINEIKVITDTGVLFRSYTTDAGFELSNRFIEKRKLYPSDQVKVQIYFHSSNRHVEYTRLYYKLLDLFSDLGGLMQIIAFSISVGYSQYNSYVQK